MFNFFKKSANKSEKTAYLYEQLRPTWSKRDYSKFAKEAYLKNVIAHQAIKLISVAAASVQLKLFSETKQGRSPITSHPILRILSHPNPAQNGKELLEALYSYRQISGNAYMLASGIVNNMPTELYALRPDYIQIKCSANILPKSYIYKVGEKSIEFPIDKLTGFSRILHLKNFNPLCEVYGLSSIEAAAYSIDQHNQAGEWNQALLQNGARPSGALIVNKEFGPLTERQYNDLKSQFNDSFSGPGNSGKPLLLEGGIEWKEMSLSPRDMDFITTKHSSARDISLALGVPPQLLGIPGDSTYSNLQEARLAFWEQTVIPLVDNTISHLSTWLSNFFGQWLELTYDLDSVSALSSRRDSLWKRIEDSSFMTINEKRAAMGLPPLTDGNTLCHLPKTNQY